MVNNSNFNNKNNDDSFLAIEKLFYLVSLPNGSLTGNTSIQLYTEHALPVLDTTPWKSLPLKIFFLLFHQPQLKFISINTFFLPSMVANNVVILPHILMLLQVFSQVWWDMVSLDWVAQMLADSMSYVRRKSSSKSLHKGKRPGMFFIPPWKKMLRASNHHFTSSLL